jgi:hypothetical protein
MSGALPSGTVHSMAQQENPALEPSVSAPRSSSAARFAISRGQLWMLIAIALPAIASLLAPMLSGDVAYQIRTGQLMLESGSLIDADPFTFTIAGEAWLNQQWGASLVLGAGFEALGWSGLLVLRAVLIGATFALVYVAARGLGAGSIVASMVTLASFVVGISNLALRSQTFGLLCFASVVALLAWRRRHPRVLWLAPLVLMVWANTHGSFPIGWLALGFAAADDLLQRSRQAPQTIVITILAIAATLVTPWTVGAWQYVAELSTNPLISDLISEWQPTTLRTPAGLFYFGSLAAVAVLLLVRGRVVSWVNLAWLAVLAIVGLMAVRGTAWWAIGAAPFVAYLISGLEFRGRRIDTPGAGERRTLGYTAIAGVLLVFAIMVLPIWRGGDALYGPEGVVGDAPRGVTEATRAEMIEGDRLFVSQRWSSWIELAIPGLPLMVDYRIELFPTEVWGDYIHVSGGRADWSEILDSWDVSLVTASVTEQGQLLPFLRDDDSWNLVFEDEEGAVFRRVADA